MDTYVLENAIRRGKKGNGQKGEMNSGSSGETKGRRETEEGGGKGRGLETYIYWLQEKEEGEGEKESTIEK